MAVNPDQCGYTFFTGSSGMWVCNETATEDVEFMGDDVRACRRHARELRDATYEEGETQDGADTD